MTFPTLNSFRSTVPLVLACCFVLSPLSARAAGEAGPVSNRNAAGEAAAAAPAGAAQSGFSPLDSAPLPAGLTAEEIIRKFGEREAAFSKARDEYTFRQTVVVNTLDDATNRPDGTYQTVTDIIFNEKDVRTEHVVFAPQNTLTRLMMSQADFDDIAHRLPFVLTTAELPQYTLT